ncbi:hypothetical protein [Treponema pedis]|uniref:hypothetical protein n=1 Tax=Treponema pedis TaxID=409322 RepID=UPI00041C76D0|nr:hypothetical protein [Treponema pedis]
MNIQTVEKDFMKTPYKNTEKLLCAFKEFYNDTKIDRQKLSYSSYDNFRKAITLQDLFLLNLPAGILSSILDIAVYKAIKDEDFETSLNGFVLYARLDFYNRIPYQIRDWVVLNSFISSDTQLLEKVYCNISYDETEIDEAFYLFKNLLRAIIVHNDEWKNKALDYYHKNISLVRSKSDTALINCLKSIAEKDDNGFCKNFVEAMKLSSKTQWLKTVYNRPALFKYCNPFVLGIANLALAENINCPEPEEDLIFRLTRAKKEYNPQPFMLFDNELIFLNEILYTDFVSSSKIISDRIINTRAGTILKNY